jgi:hypothetical protein
MHFRKAGKRLQFSEIIGSKPMRNPVFWGDEDP